MVKERLKYGLLLASIFLNGCGGGASTNSVFDLPKAPATQTNASFGYTLRSAAYPEPSRAVLEIQESEVPDNSVYLSLSANNTGSGSFQLDVKVKNVTGIYDIPLALKFDSSLFQIADKKDNTNQLIEGRESERLRRFLPSINMVLAGVNDPVRPGHYLIAHGITRDIGRAEKYSGTLFSVIVNTRIQAAFLGSIGFDTGASSVLNKDGSPISVQFFGGQIIRN